MGSREAKRAAGWQKSGLREAQRRPRGAPEAPKWPQDERKVAGGRPKGAPEKPQRHPKTQTKAKLYLQSVLEWLRDKFGSAFLRHFESILASGFYHFSLYFRASFFDQFSKAFEWIFG